MLLSISLPVQAGQTVAFYITCTEDGLNYTIGTAEGSIAAADDHLEILEGVGAFYPFGATPRPRVWNGTLYYEPGLSLPVELVSFEALTVDGAVELTWQTASETNNAGFFVMRNSEFGVRNGVFQNPKSKIRNAEWQPEGWIEGRGTTAVGQRYRFRVTNLEAGRHRFRLKQVDFGGAFTYGPEVELVLDLPETHVLREAYPNPFNARTQFSLTVAADQQVRVGLYDVTGRYVQGLFEGRLEANRARRIEIDGRGLPSGVYVYRADGETFQESRRVTLVK